jgi:magnesium transporter
VYDHVLRATEWTESLRDLVTSVQETLTIQATGSTSSRRR